tara:strand:+ start:315 stop:443 length:129 start_codon:yes stop_codon:yes gene_type:complete
MAKKAKSFVPHERKPKKTSQAINPSRIKWSSMNKSKRRQHKK